MSFHLFISRISFEYDGAVEPLFDELSLSFPGGFTGVVGANGCGKSTLLKLLTGLLTPDRGTVSASGPAVFCMQEVFEPPDGAADLFTATDGYAFRLCENLKLTPEMLARWQTLSLGERKKLQIATALFQQPDILCIDEPTNHLDMRSKDVLKEAIKEFDGTVIVVSHDREFLDGLVTKVYEFGGGVVKEHIGGIYDFLQKKKIESLNELQLSASPTMSATKKEELETVSENKLSYEAQKELNKKIRKLEKRIADCEQKIEKLETEIGEVEADMATPEGASDMALYEKHQKLKKDLDQTVEEWETVSMELEEMQGS